VWDKTGLDGFVKGLDTLGWELVASGGTAAYIEELGLGVTPVESVTEFPEMLGGRVKTLHPNIHAGILRAARVAEDLAALDAHGIAPFDLVCVNLYPFEQVAARARRPRGGGRRDDRRRRPVDAPRRGEELRARDAGVPARRLRARARRAQGVD
jgi:phosphoribosylaminoimidazolecarboxamide formyltransferase/IMP cyclohydrolase